METENARIESTFLGREDHGIFTFTIMLDYGMAGQGFGNYSLDEWNRTTEKRVGHKRGIDLIAAILDRVGVNGWEELVGKYVRVEHDCGNVYRIGHIIKDKWCNPKDFFDKE